MAAKRMPVVIETLLVSSFQSILPRTIDTATLSIDREKIPNNFHPRPDLIRAHPPPSCFWPAARYAKHYLFSLGEIFSVFRRRELNFFPPPLFRRAFRFTLKTFSVPATTFPTPFSLLPTPNSFCPWGKPFYLQLPLS